MLAGLEPVGTARLVVAGGLRADFDRLDVIDEGDEPVDYRYHDEHNADVREDIEASASGPVRATTRSPPRSAPPARSMRRS